MKYYFIVNQFAGAEHSVAAWNTVQLILRQRKIPFEFTITEYAKHATKLAQEFAEDHESGWIIVAVGGDGTLLEVLDGIRYAKNHPALGYIPAGSGNDFARTVGISFKADESLNQLLNATEFMALDVVKYSDYNSEITHYFTNNIGIGFDAQIVHQANTGRKTQLSKWHLESAAYISAIIKTFFKQDAFPLEMEIDGEKHKFDRAFLVSLTNIKYFGGGVGIAPKASLTDGKLDIVIAEQISFLKLIRLFSHVFFKGDHLTQPEIFFRTGSHIHAQSFKPEYGQVNGEDIPKQNFNIELSLEKQDFWFIKQHFVKKL